MAAIVLRLTDWPRLVAVWLIKAYQVAASPFPSPCRFVPSCSSYAMEAIGRRGLVYGSYLTIRRLARCHPFCEGGHDPVP